MSAPPIGIVMSTPKISAPTKNAATMRDDVDADRQRRDEERAVQHLLPAHAPGLVDLAVELRPRDQRARERDRADERADDRDDERHERMLDIGPQQFDRCDGGRRAAAHAVVERDHLRHRRDRDSLALPP
jgi:hypothetical protein